MENEITKIALDGWTLFAAGGVFLVLRMLGSTPLARASLYRRLLPFLPEILGTAAAFAGAIPVVADKPWSIKLVGGLWCGYLSQRAHKFLGQTLLGDDPAIESKITRSLQPEPDTEPAGPAGAKE